MPNKYRDPGADQRLMKLEQQVATGNTTNKPKPKRKAKPTCSGCKNPAQCRSQGRCAITGRPLGQ